MKRGMLVAVISVLLLTACATVPVPKMEHPDASGIAITTKINLPLFGSEYAEVVYFVKLNHPGDIRQGNVIASNYNKDGRVYLLNATPGEYVVVASKIRNQRGIYYTFFQKDAVEKIRVNVGREQIVCAGNYTLNASEFGERDLIQRHYEAVILKQAGGFGGPPKWRGTLHEAKSDDSTKSECLRKAKEDLAEGGWHALIK